MVQRNSAECTNISESHVALQQDPLILITNNKVHVVSTLESDGNVFIYSGIER